MTQDMSKAKVLNALFAQVFAWKICLHKCQAMEAKKKVRIWKILTMVKDDHVWGLDMYKSLGPNNISHTRNFSAHRAFVVMRSILTGRSSLEESKWHSYLQEGQRDLTELQANQPDFIPGKVMEQLIPEIICRHKDTKVIRSSQHAFTKRKTCLMNQTAFCNETIGLIDERRSVIVIYLDFISGFDTVFHKILTENLRRTRDEPLRKLRDWSMLHMRKGCEIWDSRETRLRESQQYVRIPDNWSAQWTWSQALFVLPSDGKKGTVHNLEHRRLPISVRKHFSLWDWQSWAHTTHRFNEIAFLGNIQKLSELVLCKRPLGDPAWGTR